MVFVYERILRNTFVLHRLPQLVIDNQISHRLLLTS